MSNRRRNSSSMRADIQELARHLREERLYVEHEKSQLQELNEKVKVASEKLAHTAWVARQQRENLDSLIFPSRGLEMSPIHCCQRANMLEQTFFQDAYKELSYQELTFSEFFRNLREKPELLATCLAVGDKLNPALASQVVSSLFVGVYGSCVLPEDELFVMRMLYHLMKLQLASASNPRKLLRQGTCAFSRLYTAFNESMFSAKLFLTSALYEPILNLLTDEEMFLDIDPNKTLVRFTPQERLQKFGKEGTPEFEEKVKRHREFVVSKLETLTNRFIEGIRDNLHCFPQNLARLLRTMYSLLMSSGHVEPKEVYAVCVDVIFDLFICPAMVDPNPVGIIDASISNSARSNLMQVAQIIQTLALWKWEDIDPRVSDLYSRFDKEVMSSVLESMLEAGELSEEDGLSHERSAFAEALSEGQVLARLSVLVTRDQIENIILLLRSVKSSGDDNVDLEELTNLLSPLPESLPEPSLSRTSSQSPSKGASETESSKSRKMPLAARFSNVANSVAHSSSMRSNSRKYHSEHKDDVTKNSDRSQSDPLVPCEAETVLVLPIANSANFEPAGFISEEQVLSRSRQASRVVRMNLANLPGACHPHSVSEENSSFISMGVGEKRTRFSLSHEEGSIGNTSDNLEAISEAASNHSVDSSLEDEVDQAEDPIIDNLSDMVSANVSGRGTPNVSVDGRDTPSSQVTEGEELAGRIDEAPEQAIDAQNENVIGRRDHQQQNRENNNGPRNRQGVDNQVPGNNLPQAAPDPAPRPGGPRRNSRRKNGEPDLEEKFGRFEIKSPGRSAAGSQNQGGPEQGDETVSMISDTWSTDVLPSDTETIGDPDNRPALDDLLRQNLNELGVRNRMLDELVVPPTTSSSSMASASAGNLLDIADSTSEAWSMDVLASDTESCRLGELDNEDSASVARSDDTRFTDDTTRSDPEPVLEISANSFGQGSSIRVRRDGDPMSLRRVGSASATESETLMTSSRKSSGNSSVEQWARQSGANTRANLITSTNLPRRGSDSSGLGVVDATKARSKPFTETSILKKTSSSQQRNGSVVHEDVRFLESSSSQGQIKGNRSTNSIASSESSLEETGAKPKLNNKPANGTVVAGRLTMPSPSLLDTDNPPPPSPSALNVTRSAPTSATGAIPKSISFDKTVFDNSSFDSSSTEGRQGSGKARDRNIFFKGFKLPKIGRGASSGSNLRSSNSASRMIEESSKSNDEVGNIPEDCEGAHMTRRTVSDDTTDDILAKYRKKGGTGGEQDHLMKGIDANNVDGIRREGSDPEVDERLVIDPNDLESSFAFQDAKRKLRLMLSVADLGIITMLQPRLSTTSNNHVALTHREENELIWFLKVQLAEAHNLQDSALVAQLHETLRCVSLFNHDGCRKLLRSLKEDYKKRTPYLSYLVRCRQGLLATLSQQQRLLSRMQVDQKICTQYLVSVFIRLFMEKSEQDILNFVHEFKEVNVADEKIALTERFLNLLWKQLEENPSWALVATEDQMQLAKLAIERLVISQIYMYAMYPNGDADISRDSVFAEHISRLSGMITPGHRYLRVPAQYVYEAPWPSAQAEIRRLPAYKTAREKVACVVRCSQTIMNLLSLASSKSVPAADDFVPVMVFVLIKANPSGLLSTVQYVESFYGSRLSGEDQYWWMQFVAAVEFIKTMDYR